MSKTLHVEITQADIDAAETRTSGEECPYAQAFKRMGYEHVFVGFKSVVFPDHTYFELPPSSEKSVMV